MDGSAAESTDDGLYDVQESKRWLVLFVGEADEILTHVREVARKTEKQIDRLLRADVPSPHQRPHLEPPVQGMDESQESL